MTEKRFTEYVPDSYGYTYAKSILDNQNSKRIGNFTEIVNLLNELNDENEQLKQKHRQLQIDFNDACSIVHDLRENKLDLEDENEQLKKELYDITIDYYTETYFDNSVRRDEHIKDFKEEFKAKYGDVE